MSKSPVEKIKNLRDDTGLSFNEIKKALDDAGGDEAKAKEALKAYGVAMAAKRSAREAKEGIIESYIHTTKKVGALVELLCETDFVARNAEFQQLAKDIAMHVVAMKPSDTAQLLTQPFVKNPEITIQDLITQTVGKIGENIQLGQFAFFEI
ncbi:MAG: translation elongation factor Ts [Candidatus Yanofskybacteria bacterium]|nr:translation elongation factor Ts [Candidatus Yanofskybacteria bacterium]